MAVGNRGGRPRKPTALHLLEGTYEKSRHDKRVEPQYEQRLLPPPKHLDAVAKRRYRELGNLLLSKGVITVVDMGILAIYAESWSNWIHASIEAQQDVARQAALEAQWDSEAHDFAYERLEQRLRTLERRARWTSSAVVRSREERSMLDKLGSRLGLSPSDRARVHAQPRETPSEFEEFLRGSNTR